MPPKRQKLQAITNFFAKQPRPSPDEVQERTNNPIQTSSLAEPTTPPISRSADLESSSAAQWCHENGIAEDPLDCRVHDFVRCDPVDRPPNIFAIRQLQEDPKLRRGVIFAYSKMNLFRPRLTCYPSRSYGKRSRSFQPEWFENISGWSILKKQTQCIVDGVT